MIRNSFPLNEGIQSDFPLEIWNKTWSTFNKCSSLTLAAFRSYEQCALLQLGACAVLCCRQFVLYCTTRVSVYVLFCAVKGICFSGLYCTV